MLKIGTQVKMVRIDKYGFNGRERHPTVDHVGCFQGTVCDAVDATPDDDFRSYCYLVCNRDGDCLELMHDEVEVLPVAPQFVVVVSQDDAEIPDEVDVSVGLATDEAGVWRLLREASKAGRDWAVFEIVGHKAIRRAVTFQYERVETGVKLS